MAIAKPIINSHPAIGSKSTNNIPTPNPTKHTPIVFLKALNIFIPPIFLLYYIVFCKIMLPILVYFINFFPLINISIYVIISVLINYIWRLIMTINETNKLIQILRKTYPEAKCSLDFNNPFELVVAVMLSAQCTDERVNLTTPQLFKICKTIQDFADINIEELEELIHPCGFYKNKAKNIKKCAKQILDNFNGEVPCDMDSLLSLAGIGRKSANVIMLEAFNNPVGIAVDTHAKRISNRLGFSANKEPSKIEQDLLKIIPKEYYKDVNHLLVWHGRNLCTARNPKCNKCPLAGYCNFDKNI